VDDFIPVCGEEFLLQPFSGNAEVALQMLLPAAFIRVDDEDAIHIHHDRLDRHRRRGARPLGRIKPNVRNGSDRGY
jgi:hypothetical protein